MASKRNRKVEYALTVTAGAYADGDVVGGRLDLSSVAKAGGEIRRIRLVDDSNVGAALYLYLFDEAPTSIANNDPFAAAIVIADHKKLIDRISIVAGDYLTINSNKTALKSDLNISHCTGQLYGYLVCNGSTPTYLATTDLTLIFDVWDDLA